MITQKIMFTRMRRELNTIVRHLTSEKVDVYVVMRNGEEYIALVGLPTVERWYKQPELLAEIARRAEFETVPSDEDSTDSEPEDAP